MIDFNLFNNLEHIYSNLSSFLFNIIPILISLGSLTVSIVSIASAGRREKIRREREQASRIACWISRPGQPDVDEGNVTIVNNSGTPVYEMCISIGRLSWGTRQGELKTDIKSKPPKCYDIVPPGRFCVTMEQAAGLQGMHRHPGLEMAFVDADGRSWIRTASGRLSRIWSTPATHYDLGYPVESIYSPEVDSCAQ